jgi:hypothetical protein
MEPFIINLNQMDETSGRFRRFLVILAIFFILISALSFTFFYSKDDPKEWIFAVLGFYALVFIYFAYVGRKAKIYFSADDFAIEFQFGFFMKTPNAIIWETIKKVKIGPTYITFFKRSGKGKKVQLGWLPYAKVIEIKKKVKCFSESKGLEVEIAEFNKDQSLSEQPCP